MTTTARGTVAVSVAAYVTTARGTVALSVHGPATRARGTVAVSVLANLTRARGTVALSVRGPATRSHGTVGVSIREFTGTRIKRSRRRDPFPLLVGGAALDGTPPPPPVDPPPAPSADWPTTTFGHTFWSATLPDVTTAAPTSAAHVARIAYQASMTRTTSPVKGLYDAPFNTVTNGSNKPGTDHSGAYALPVYRMPIDAPRVPVFTSGFDKVKPKTGLQAVLDEGVPLPDPLLLPGGTIPPSGTDGSVIILCGDEMWELWQLRLTTDPMPIRQPNVATPPGYDWVCTSGGKITNKNTHPGIWSSPQDWGVAAAGTSKLGGTLTADDYYRGTIGHPLGLALPITGGDQSLTPKEPHKLLPATRYDWRFNILGGLVGNPEAEHYRIAEGHRFRLPATFDIDAYIGSLPTRSSSTPAGTPALSVTADQYGSDAIRLRMILEAVRDHGILIEDSSDSVTFAAEHPKTFGTPYNPYSLAERPVWGNFGQQIPWTSLVQVAAPTVSIAVAGD